MYRWFYNWFNEKRKKLSVHFLWISDQAVSNKTLKEGWSVFIFWSNQRDDKRLIRIKRFACVFFLSN